MKQIAPLPPPLSGWCVSARHDSAKNANFAQNNVLEKSARLLRVRSPIKKSILMYLLSSLDIFLHYCLAFGILAQRSVSIQYNQLCKKSTIVSFCKEEGVKKS